MTLSISAELKAEMLGPLSKLATCMRLERTDGNVYGFTTHDRPLTIDGVVYEPAASFNPTDIASGSNLDTDNLTITGVLDSDTITEEELRAGYWDYAAFRIFQVNWDDLSMGVKRDRAGHLGNVSVHRQTFVVEMLGLMEAYSISVGELSTPMCRASLGDERCRVDINAVGSPPTSGSVSGTIDTADTDFFTLHDSARTEPDGFFDEGVVTIHYTTGDRRYEVKAYIAGTWVTKTPYAYDATGVAYTMTRGCDRRFETCRDTFNNVINFRGEPWLRGNDKLLQIGRK